MSHFDPNDIRPPSGRLPAYSLNSGDDELPPFVREVEGAWNVVYSWPPLETQRQAADIVTFICPSKLETAVFSCRCRPDNFDFLAPIKILDTAGKVKIYASQMVLDESEVLDALSRDRCGCRDVPLATKFVLLSLNDEYLFKYIRLQNAEYTAKNFCHVYLLHKKLPSVDEIRMVLRNMDLSRRRGASTYVRDDNDGAGPSGR